MLLPLTMIFGWPAIIGITIGTGVANIFGGLGPVDIFGGSIANLVGCGLAYILALRLRRFFWPGVIFLGTWIINLVVTLIVGSYLAYLFGEPLAVGLLGIFIGSLVSVNFAGFTLAILVYLAGIHDPQIRHLIKVSFKGTSDAG